MSNFNIVDLSKKIGDYTEGHLLKRAKEIVEDKTRDSDVLDTAAEARIPKFEKSGKLRAWGL